MRIIRWRAPIAGAVDVVLFDQTLAASVLNTVGPTGNIIALDRTTRIYLYIAVAKVGRQWCSGFKCVVLDDNLACTKSTLICQASTTLIARHGKDIVLKSQGNTACRHRPGQIYRDGKLVALKS